jgi:hypothetical protein
MGIDGRSLTDRATRPQNIHGGGQERGTAAVVRIVGQKPVRVLLSILMGLLFSAIFFVFNLQWVRAVFYFMGAKLLAALAFSTMIMLSYACNGFLLVSLQCAGRVAPCRANSAFAYCIVAFSLRFVIICIFLGVGFDILENVPIEDPRYIFLPIAASGTAIAVAFVADRLYRAIFGDPHGMKPDIDEAVTAPPDKPFRDIPPLVIPIMENAVLRAMLALVIALAVFVPFGYLLLFDFNFNQIFEEDPDKYLELLADPQMIISLLLLTSCIFFYLKDVFLPCLKRRPAKANSICAFFIVYNACLMVLAFVSVMIGVQIFDSILEIMKYYPIHTIAALLLPFGVLFWLVCKAADKLYKKVFDDPVGMAHMFKLK